MSTSQDLLNNNSYTPLMTNINQNENNNIPIIIVNNIKDPNVFENINSINEIPHNIISQPESNKFIIKLYNSLLSVLSYIAFTFVIFLCFYCYIIIIDKLRIIISLSFFLSIGLIMFYYRYRTLTFILNEKNIQIEKNNLCKNISIYNSDEIKKIKFHIKERLNNSYYYLVIEDNYGEINISGYYGSSFFTQEEMRYFCYIINNHIEKMKNI